MRLCDQALCTSCSACVEVCPKNAVKMTANEYGFIYPEIDESLCINCELCAKKCHINNDLQRNYPEKAYAVWSSDQEDRRSSTSGGAASVFYQKVLADGGICYGATYDKNLNVVIRGYEDNRIKEFKNSKYVHSDMDEVCRKIKSDLKSGKKVIFIGLPCQIASVKTFFGEDYDNLLLVDIVCHGTPPQKYLDEHIYFIEKKKNKKASKIKFRNENEYYFIVNSSDNKRIANIHRDIDTYLISFFESLTYYESCYSCKYACNERVSDITIGDFWGLGEEEPFDHPYSGAVSLVLVNTKKGSDFFNSVKDKCFCEERSVQEAIKGNAQLNKPSKRNGKRDLFLEQYKNSGFETAVQSVYGEYIKKHKPIVRKMHIERRIRAAAKKILRRKHV